MLGSSGPGSMAFPSALPTNNSFRFSDAIQSYGRMSEAITTCFSSLEILVSLASHRGSTAESSYIKFGMSGDATESSRLRGF